MVVKEYQPKLYQDFQKIISENRLSHAYLFSGDFSTFEMALAISKALFCQSKQNGEACGVCRTCRMIAEATFPDLKIIEPTGKVIKTDLIRDMVGEFAQSGFEGQSQVFIIKESEKLHPNAANSLLKIIEEPSSDSYIFLLTSDDSKILPTIKSRCQLIHFPSNKTFISQQLEAQGLLKNQAQLLRPLVKDLSDIQTLAKSSKTLDLLKACQYFMTLWLAKSQETYLEVARLAALAVDKNEQEQVFVLLMGLLENEKRSLYQAVYLDALTKARQMWLANVSLQNALDYMVLTVDKLA